MAETRRSRLPLSLRALGRVLRLSFQVDARSTMAVLALSTVASLTGPVFGVAMKIVTDAVTRHDSQGALVGAAVIAGVLALELTVGFPQFTISSTLNEKVAHAIDRQIVDLTAGIPGLEHHERPEYADKVQLLINERYLIGQPAFIVLQVFNSVVAVAGAAFVLGRVHPLLLLVPLSGVPVMLAGALRVQMQQRALTRTAKSTRLANYLFKLAGTPGPAKELRIFGLRHEVLRRQQEAAGHVIRENLRTRLFGSVVGALGSALAELVFVGAVVFVVLRAIKGQSTPGDVVLTVTVASQAQQYVAGIVGSLTSLLSILKAVGRYIWLEDYARSLAGRAESTVAAPDRITSGIRFEDVSFTYPGTEKPVITGASIDIPAGATVAIVGDNGAGKTTIVKLLCRFYEPTAGSITVDGVDLRTMDYQDWRRHIAAGFQDFARYELLASENIGVGDLPRLEDMEAVREALRRADSEDLVEVLPQGLATQLGKSFDDGAELSTGQWQKLALGRAMMRDAPLLLVLDEPTASLDANTEHALFERYAAAARTLGNQLGTITVLVSHRFSTVRMADLIIVIDGGRVAEVGSHDELMRLDRLYAELYGLQAKAYR